MQKFYIISVGVFFLCIQAIGVRGATITATVAPGIFEPGAPQNIAVTVGDKSVDLAWSAPFSDGGASITDYIIQYKTSVAGAWSVYADGISTNTTAEVTGLANDTEYQFRVVAENSVGMGDPSSTISSTPGSPAQVLITSVSDSIIPTVSASVRITNEGSDQYEYQYRWCVTDSELNLCGGGDDLFTASAAKLIQASEDWDTTLSATLSTTGQKWFHLEVTFGSDTSYASQVFTASEESTPTPPSEGSSGSGGGGGGGGGGGISSSFPIPPSIATEQGALSSDMSNDGVVNSVDFSILLAFWKTTPPFANPRVDINNDGAVDSVDFSILLYQWSR